MVTEAINANHEVIENNNNCIVSLNNLSVGYEKKIIVDGVCLDIKPGQIFTLIGPNGSGKSTILKTITRELERLGGSIYIESRNMDEATREDIAKKMSIVSTRRPHTELMTIRDVVEMGRYPYTGRIGKLNDDDKRIVDEAMNMLDIADESEMDFNNISDGQRQRVLLARALAQDPQILVLDEPTSYLDIRYKLDILKCIHRVAKEKNVAVIMSLHELELVRGIADIIVCIENNKIGKTGTPDEIFCDGYIPRLYGIDIERFDESTGTIIIPKWDD